MGILRGDAMSSNTQRDHLQMEDGHFKLTFGRVPVGGLALQEKDSVKMA
jgi:hypothetical protein